MLCFIILLASALQVAATPAVPSGTPPERKPPPKIVALFKRLGIDPDVYMKLAGVRGRTRADGSLVLSLDLSTGRERVLSEGAAWSPLPLPDGRVLIVRTDGIWSVATAGKDQSSRVMSWSPDALLGVESRPTPTILAVERRTEASGCVARIARFSIPASSSAVPVDVTTEACADDPSAVVRGALRLQGERLIDTATGPGGGLVMATIPAGRNASDVEFDLLQIAHPVEGILERYDPVWSGPSSLVYIGRR